MQPTMSPAMAGARKSRFSSSEPKRAMAGVHADRQRHAAALGHAEFFCSYQVVAVIQAHATVLFRLLDAQQAQVAKFFEQVVNRKLAGLFPFIAVRIDFLFDEIADGLSEGFVFGCEFHFLYSGSF